MKPGEKGSYAWCTQRSLTDIKQLLYEIFNISHVRTLNDSVKTQDHIN